MNVLGSCRTALLPQRRSNLLVEGATLVFSDMPPRLLPSASSTLSKRARSADHSSGGTPITEKFEIIDDSTLPSFLRQSTAELSAKFEDLNAKQQARFEHYRLNKDAQSPWAQEASNSAKLRNRYLDIRPWDKTRVRLKVPEGLSDYINASSIVLRCKKTGEERRYIATQGPKDGSVDHFWQMVWHETEDVAVIVMLTQLTEGFREKCIQYFPDNTESDPLELTFNDPDGEEEQATVQVKDCTYDDVSKTTIRTLQLSYRKEKKLVYHLFFLGWPDYGVPADISRTALLDLIKLSREKNRGWSNARIVHCSAGVGRSGTFIALEHLLAELEAGALDDLDSDTAVTDSNAPNSSDPVFETVDSLREQRMTMVQSEAQFQFLYDILAEAARARLRETAMANKINASLSLGTELQSPSGEPVLKAMRFSRSFRAMISTIRDRSIPRRPSTRDKQIDSKDNMAGEGQASSKQARDSESQVVADDVSSPSRPSDDANEPDIAMDNDMKRPPAIESHSEGSQRTQVLQTSDESQLPDAWPSLPSSGSEDEDEDEMSPGASVKESADNEA